MSLEILSPPHDALEAAPFRAPLDKEASYPTASDLPSSVQGGSKDALFSLAFAGAAMHLVFFHACLLQCAFRLRPRSLLSAKDRHRLQALRCPGLGTQRRTLLFCASSFAIEKFSSVSKASLCTCSQCSCRRGAKERVVQAWVGPGLRRLGPTARGSTELSMGGRVRL